MSSVPEPDIEYVLDRLAFATLAELVNTAAVLERASDETNDRGTRALLLTLQELVDTCAHARDHDLDIELWRITNSE